MEVLCLIVLSIGPGVSPVCGQQLTPADSDLFENHVRPVLTAHCIKCHGESKQEGGLVLTSLEAILEGGDSGPAIEPGDPDESLLLQALRYESYEMPPDKRLGDELTGGIEKWIAADAPWPKDVVLETLPEITDDDREWWCFQPVVDPDVPKVDDHGWCRNEIDHFIFKRLADNGIEPAKEAKAEQLTRRVHFAITGLPPGEEMSSIVSGGGLRDGMSYESLVEKLLNEKSYGENQARFWLDLVRYAETDGYRADFARPEAHHYRDYVIRSFNEDKPYDRFVMEQLAGDEIDPGNRDALIGTMYLRHWIYEHNQRDVETQWHQILDDITETTADVFLASGMKCARCHDHKFDPLLQKDYFRMKAFFAALQPSEDLPIGDVEARTVYHEQLRAWEKATDKIRLELHEIESPALFSHATREGVDKFTGEIKAMIYDRAEDRTPYEHQIASLATRQFETDPEKLPEWLDEKTEARRQELRKQLAEFDSLKPAPLPTLKFVATDVGTVAPVTFIPDDRAETPIEPGFPTIIESEPAEIVPTATALQTTGRRTALAKWIADPKNPLTARVIVNRVWQQHFGRGLVATSSDFGRLGKPPTHPELLDWLACRFVEDGWSIKKLHRRILTSASYRQSSLRPMNDRLRELDPGNSLLWRMNARRLSGEEIIDAVLSATSELSGKQKRAVYRPVVRNKLDPLLKLFDFPDRIRSSGKRHRTTTSTQALLLMNNSWSHDRAAALAKTFSQLNDQEMVSKAYRSLYCRNATADEIEMAGEFLRSYRSSMKSAYSTKPIPAEPKTAMLDRQPAIELQDKTPKSIQIPITDTFPRGDFTFEATVLLKSLYLDASVRTIATNWTAGNKENGWSIGVTSAKSAYKPRNLILQLTGGSGEEKSVYEVVPSGIHLELNKPYYIAVSVELDAAKGVAFYAKDLSDEKAVMQKAAIAHKVNRDVWTKHDVRIGSRGKSHLWDGLIGSVRLHDAALIGAELKAGELKNGKTDSLVFDIRFADTEQLGEDVSGNEHHALINANGIVDESPNAQARITLLHTLLNSNEFIYVD